MKDNNNNNLANISDSEDQTNQPVTEFIQCYNDLMRLIGNMERMLSGNESHSNDNLLN